MSNVVAVSGTRCELFFVDMALIIRALIEWESALIHLGDCPTGVDRFLAKIRRPSGRRVFYADWHRYGASAGPRRNAQMLQGVDALLAFPRRGLPNRGTRDAIRQAEAEGILTYVHELPERAP